MEGQYLIYGSIIDAKTAEQGSRMQAMQQATENVEYFRRCDDRLHMKSLLLE